MAYTSMYINLLSKYKKMKIFETKNYFLDKNEILTLVVNIVKLWYKFHVLKSKKSSSYLYVKVALEVVITRTHSSLFLQKVFVASQSVLTFINDKEILIIKMYTEKRKCR